MMVTFGPTVLVLMLADLLPTEHALNTPTLTGGVRAATWLAWYSTRMQSRLDMELLSDDAVSNTDSPSIFN